MRNMFCIKLFLDKKILFYLEIRWNQHEPISLEKNDIPFSICDAAATNQYVNNLTVSVQPNPIVIKPAKQISLDIGLDLLKEIPIGSRISLKLKKDDWIDIPIPCLKVCHDDMLNTG